MGTTSGTVQVTEGIIWKQLLSFFFPILMGSFFQQMYNTVDTIIVGRAIGTQALAAVGSSASLINLINGFFIGLSSGAGVILSQHFGAKEPDGIRKAIHTGFLLSLILGLITMALGICLSPRSLALIQTPDNCMDEAVLYAQVFFTGAIASMVYNMGTGLLRAMGDSRRPMHFLMISCVLNIFMDILCVVVWDLGVAGAALATVFSQWVSALLTTAALCRMQDVQKLHLHQLHMDMPTLKRILVIGVSAGAQFMTYDLSNLISQSCINSFGDVTGAAWIAYIKADSIIWMVITAFGVAITTFAGQNYGARKYERIKKGVWVCMGMSAALVLLLSAVEVGFRDFILGIYTTDLAVIHTGAYIVHMAVPFCILFVPVEVLGGAMRGSGYSLVPTLITTIFACVFRTCWIFLVVNQLHTLSMLVICYPISWFLCAVVFFIVYLRGRWLRISPQTSCSDGNLS